MSESTREAFQNALKAALDTYHDGWHVRYHVSVWEMRHHQQWEQNRQLGVWVDTLRRWVTGENFPRVKKFEGFLAASALPEDVQANLFKLFHAARIKPRVHEYAPLASDVRVIGTPPIASRRLFVGRTTALEQLDQWVMHNGPLLTIVGRGGMGKTALACQALDRAIGNSDQIDAVIYTTRPTLEQIYLSCAQVLDDDELRQIWASPNPLSHKLDILLIRLAELHIIILLDELDSVLDRAGQFVEPQLQTFIEASLRPQSPLHLLITSRHELSLPISLHHQQAVLALDTGLDTAEGVDFLRRLDANNTWGLLTADTTLLTTLVARVNGSPRALEVLVGVLASGRLANVDALLTHFEQLTDIQEVLMAGYQLLDTTEREVIEALAVLGEAVKPEAVAYLLDIKIAPVMAMVQRLLRARLVVGSRASGEIHLQPLEADLIYRGLDNAQRLILEQRAIAYYQAEAQPASTWTAYADAVPQLRIFEHLIRAGRISTAANSLIKSPLRQRLLGWGYGQKVIAMHCQLRQQLDDPYLQATNEYYLGDAYQLMGEFEQAALAYEKTIDLARQLDDTQQLARGLMGLGQLNHQLGSYEAAIDAYEQTLGVTETKPDVAILCAAQIGLGRAYHQLGETDVALVYITEAHQVAHASHHPHLAIHALQIMGEIWHFLGEFDTSLEQLDQALTLARSHENLMGEIHALNQISRIYSDFGQFAEAQSANQKALAIAERLNAHHEHADCLTQQGIIQLLVGDETQGRLAITAAVDMADASGARQIEAEALHELGWIYLLAGDTTKAGYIFEQLHQISGALRNRTHWSEWHNTLACYALATDQTEMAKIHIKQALAMPASPDHHHALFLQGVRKWQKGDADGARIVFNKALAVAQLPKLSHTYTARYSQGLAYTGLALTDPDQAATWLHAARETYQAAYEYCSASGVVKRAQFWLGLLGNHQYVWGWQ